MTLKEKMLACKKQFVFESFYETYCSQLTTLLSSVPFMDEIKSVVLSTEEPLLYGCGVSDTSFKKFKDVFCDRFFETLKFAEFPAYRDIYYDVKNSGYSGKSATISVFYALIMLDLTYRHMDETHPCETNKKPGLFAPNQ